MNLNFKINTINIITRSRPNISIVAQFDILRPQTPLGELTAPPDPLAGFKGVLLLREEKEGEEKRGRGGTAEKERKGEGEGEGETGTCVMALGG